MFRLFVENEKGDKLELTNSDKYDVIEIDGLNPPVANINLVEIANVDGAHFNSSRIQTRNVVLRLNIKPPIEANRINLYKYFRAKRYVKLSYKNDTRDVYTEGYVETFENNQFDMTQQPQISIICPNPFWKSTNETEVDFSSTSALFEFPFSIPVGGIEFSRINRVTTTYLNAGEVATGAIIKFHATANGITNPVFYNLTTNKFFGLTFEMNEGDEIIINTLQGEKSVSLIRSGTKTNILSARQALSDWIVFEPGVNEISYDADHGQANLRVSVIAVQKFEGV